MQEFTKDDQYYKDIFKKKLIFYMNLRGKTQQDITQDLGLSTSTISDYCTGKKFPRIGKIQMLSDYLGVSVCDLITENTNNFSGSFSNSNILQGTEVVQNNLSDTKELSDQQKELLNIFDSLDVRGQSELILSAYEIRDKYKQ